jgi:hypothetical protein
MIEKENRNFMRFEVFTQGEVSVKVRQFTNER